MPILVIDANGDTQSVPTLADIDFATNANLLAALDTLATLIGALISKSPQPNALGQVVLSSNSTVNLNQIGGIAVATGLGASSTGTQRVVVSTDSIINQAIQGSQPLVGYLETAQSLDVLYNGIVTN